MKDDLNFDLSRDVALTKSKGWTYEKEWRIMREGGDVEIKYEPASLTGVYFGCAIPKDHKDVLTAILSGTSTKIYEMKRHQKEFQVSVEYEFLPHHR